MITKYYYLKFLISLIILSLIVLVSSCTQNVDIEAPTDESTTDIATESITTTEEISDNLPVKNFDGYNFRILCDDDYIHFVFTPEITGQVVNDAVYEANVSVMERFNINIEQVVHSVWTAGNEVQQYILSGDDAFDIGIIHDITAATLSLENLFINLYDVEHFDFTKPWWPKYTVESMTLNNKMYLISNYMTYYGFWSTRTIFFNQDLVESYNLESPYDLVRNNEWTLDKAISITKDIYEDLDGNGISDYNDLFGFASTVPYCYLENFGIEAYSKSVDGTTLELLLNNEKTITLLDKMSSWLVGGEVGTYYSSTHTGRYEPDSSNTMFANGNVVFTYGAIGHLLTGLTDTYTNYGIIPNPKYDNTQANYIAACVEIPGFIPTTTIDLERTSIIVEAMSAEGYKKVIPAYYEIALKNRYSYDTDSADMLDIMFENRVLSFSYMYGGGSGFQHIINNILSSKQNFTSYYAANESAQLKRIETIMAYYGE